jgi:hypothetical protein
MAVITDEMKVAMQGIIPSAIVTCSKDGSPNIAYVSQVYYVDGDHVAVSHQFFTKSIRNIQDNPQVSVSIVSPEDAKMWRLDLLFSHSETTGDLFDQMSLQLEAIASMTGMEDVFRLQSAYVFKILNIETMA